MKVVLLKNVDSLGKEGDIVDVSDGHARNFLFPQKKAVPATDAAMQQARERKEKERQTEQRTMDKASHAANQIDGSTFEVEKKANEDGKLYGAVQPDEIKEVITEAVGVDMSQAKIDDKQTIDTIGEYAVKISFPDDLKATVKLQVNKK